MATHHQAPPAVPVFDPAHLPILTLVAACALQCVQFRSTEEYLDALLDTPIHVTDVPAGETAGPVEASSAPHAVTTADNRTTTLSALYPEVRVLECVHRIRSLLRKLQECSPHALRGMLELVEKQFATLHNSLPDPLFAALAEVAHSLQSPDDEGTTSSRANPPPDRRLFDTQALEVIERLQQEVLAQSRRLTVRCTTITLRYRSHPPF